MVHRMSRDETALEATTGSLAFELGDGSAARAARNAPLHAAVSAPQPKVRCLIADDEPFARRRLRDLLDEVDWVMLVGEVGNGREAVATIDQLTPDLVFLDVKMPRLNGLQVARRVRHRPAIIFCTAHDDYAVQAFGLGALDYLIKPFGRDRLAAALERVRRALGHDRYPYAAPAPVNAPPAPAAGKPLTRFLVRRGPGIVPIAVNQIERIEAARDYVAVFVGGQASLVYIGMSEFETRLDPDRFVRVHRSHIVNLDFVTNITPRGDGRLTVTMRDKTPITASRSGSRVLRERALSR
jgi:two-component system LytT family response regulator